MADINLTTIRSGVIYRDVYSYTAHPHAVRLENGEIVLVFNQSVRRRYVLHPPEDPRYINFVIRSTDEGASWSTPRVVPGYNWSGMECSGFTDLGAGHLMINQWQFDWLTTEAARRQKETEAISFPADWVGEMTSSCELEHPDEIAGDPNELAPWARASGQTYVHHSYDGGRTWEETIRIDTGSYSGGYGMRGAAVLSNGTIFLPMSDVPHYQKVFGVKSSDGGHTWSEPSLVAAADGMYFEEPCPFVNERGQVVVLLRENSTRSLFHARSSDNGDTWTKPVPVGVNGYPADIDRLEDGRFLMVFGRRVDPLGIFAVVSKDGTASEWNVADECVIDAHFPNKNLGYPTIVKLSTNRFFVAYYGEDTDGTTCLWGAEIEFSLR